MNAMPATVRTEAESPHTDVSYPVESIGRILFHNAAEHPATVSIRRAVDGGLVDVTAVDLLREVSLIAKGLIAAGIEPGQRVSIFSRTSYEWTVFGWAIWLAGGVATPIYETSSPEQVRWILTDAEVRGILVESTELRAVVEEATTDPAGVRLRHIWTVAEGGMDELRRRGESVADADLEARSRLAGRADIATLIYTSGTTGRPKGCEITHGGFIDVVAGVHGLLARDFIEPDASSTVLFLPLAHVLARILEIGCVFFRATIVHEPDTTKVVEAFGEVHPTFIVAVPRVLEKVYNAAASKASAAGGLKEKIFKAAAATAIEYSQSLESGGPGLGLRLRRWFFDKLVYGKLHEALGGRCGYIVSGGGPLGARLGHFYRGVGFELIEGYGMTESSGVLSFNLVGAAKMGTVGVPLPGIAMRIADDGEILVKGDSLFRGYHNNPEATAKEWEGPWFHTGDLGTLDEDGYLSITGRKKDIIVTAGGKNVAPAPLEDAIRSHPLISQAMVVGDNRSYIAALVTIDPEGFEDWKARHGREGTLAELVDSEALRAEVQSAVDRGNRMVSRAESVREFRILLQDWTVETNELTPTLKLKRPVVAKNWASEIESLYG